MDQKQDYKKAIRILQSLGYLRSYLAEGLYREWHTFILWIEAKPCTMTKVVYLGAKTNKNKTRIKGKNPIKKKQNVKKF